MSAPLPAREMCFAEHVMPVVNFDLTYDHLSNSLNEDGSQIFDSFSHE
jgi:hypothetical protein